ncbi:MAG: 5-amino-6-(D-ribitylamino)uracil--L-tyrosine 4-hydroxyphenyl transferase CofH [Solirubrobacterales bacterium]|nr:5-amino-6-(D-ribitylamino)uracil--L-tyrosine 4-hydroxyphenyl transferase CofH [Solirubrobacterales bacterium]HMT06241.1 5-amino-6-(D-ribitylamino)uracil--L-tyrosine 4-hydroxyphenyl transferase CofH [Solirubrobacterales bacterium]
MRRVTFSRNYTISLSRTCQCYCKYCAFATHQAHIHPPDDVERMLDEAVKKRAKELLFLTGEKPEVNPVVKEQLRSWGHEDFTSYVIWACERALERGILPHTNIGAIGASDLARLREVTASQGLMLESASERLMKTVHAGSPTKHPAHRLKTIEAAGRLKIPFTTGILVGIGETPEERIESLEKLAELHRKYGHIQEVIIQNFVPHPRYYGQEPAEIAAEASDRRWRESDVKVGLDSGVVDEADTGQVREGTGPDQGDSGRPSIPLPDWACAVTIEDLKHLIRETARLMPGVGVQVPPNLSDWWAGLVEAGATDLGGLSANGDHISPEHPFPSPHQVRKELQPLGYALTERLCVYPQYMNAEWMEQGVLDVIKLRFWSFIPRLGSGRVSEEEIDPGLAIEAIAKGGEGEPLSEDELTALFAETRPEVIESMRIAADRLRHDLAGDTATFVVNRNINFTNICTVGCAFCGFGQGRRSPDAYESTEEEFRGRVEEAVEFGATELCMQGGIHPELDLEAYGRWLKLAKSVAPEIHLHAYSPMEINHMCETSGLSPEEVFAYLIDCGLGSTPGTAAEVLDDGVRQRISPNKLPADRWVEIIEASHRAGLKSTSTVMFGHIEEPRELARHMKVIRNLQERTGGITEFVPLSFIPFNTLLGRTHGVEEISIEENLKHTAAFRLALGRSITNLQASWVKMGLDGATEALNWGVNDLGGTLMEESISRMAGSQHGVRLEAEELVDAAHRAGRNAAQRNTSYEIIQEFPDPVSSPPPDLVTNLAGPATT